ncbi:microfibril-associated glycoprotein 4-like [Myripristis murdjan]|uniref:microfibril-associated glycoprotein 4-like n=1 Tax=Myripristis murdjan TaxID=586833 RepID=UPI001175DA50|nr:microfibril-associated glycoprotein 4-like [Myripristis murdjan]
MKLESLLFLVLAPVLIHCYCDLPADCSDIYKDKSNTSGVYTIYPVGSTSGVQVYCDMTSEGGQWTVIQRRMDGSQNFYRPWCDYKMGFGAAAGEYWLGLENIFHLTLRRSYELLVDMEDFDGKKVSARYSSFSIAPESYGYKLQVSGFTDGGAGDSLAYHNGQKFSTMDKDQDASSVHCARRYLGAFWYNNCHHANPNGIYRRGADSTIFAVGVDWYRWRGHDYSLKSFSMKICPVK